MNTFMLLAQILGVAILGTITMFVLLILVSFGMFILIDKLEGDDNEE